MRDQPTTDLPPGHKRCSECGEVKPLNTAFFNFDYRKKGRYRNPCKACRRLSRRIPFEDQQRNKARRRAEVEARRAVYQPPPEKACTGCGEVKALEGFKRFRHAKDGRASECRTCTSKRDRRYRENNREVCRARDRDYYWRTAPVRREESRKYREAHREEILAYLKEYRNNNREARRAWSRANPHKNRAMHTRRRIWKLRGKVEGVVVDRQAIIDRDAGRCHVCGIKCKPWRKEAGKRGQCLTIDHLIPLAEGGLDVPENLAVACLSCNARRSNRRQIATQLLLLGE